MVFLSVSGGLLIGAGVWTFVKGGVKALRSLARRTKTTKDDRIIDKIDEVRQFLEDNPEVVDALHQMVKAITK